MIKYQPNQYPVRDVVAASFESFTKNGGTVYKYSTSSDNNGPIATIKNIDMISFFIKDEFKGISEESYKLADECIDEIRLDYRMSRMREEFISEFKKKIGIMISQDKIAVSKNMGLIAYIPQYYRYMQKEYEAEKRFKKCDNSTFPREGMQNLLIEIVTIRKIKFSGSYMMQGITADNQAVMFYLQEKPTTNFIKIRAKFKRLDDKGLIVLTYIKLIEQIKA